MTLRIGSFRDAQEYLAEETAVYSIRAQAKKAFLTAAVDVDNAQALNADRVTLWALRETEKQAYDYAKCMGAM